MNIEFNKDFAPSRKQQGQLFSGISLPPAIGKDYWLFRVKIKYNQSVVAFPKHGTLGIGFQYEKYYDTNLPYEKDSATIYNHIKGNRRCAKKDKCIQAIEMLKKSIDDYISQNHE